MPASPSPLNYFIGKGIPSIKIGAALTYNDMGNAPEVEFTPSIESLAHFSSRLGTRTKDREVIIEKGGTLRIVLDEWTMENLSLALLGDISTNSDGDEEIDIMSQNSITAAFKFVGTNEVGAQVTLWLNKVEFKPSSTLGLVSDEWGQIELTGEVLSDNLGKFGRLVQMADGA
jgi:hypothetical protein